MNRPILTPARLDEMLEGKKPSGTSRIIWTAGSIGARIGRSEDFVRKTLAREDGTPIRYLGRRLYAFEDDLLEFMRRDEHEVVDGPQSP